VKDPAFFAAYTTSLKEPCAEEIIDLVLYRPLGFLFVKTFYPFPVTPNHVSLLAMAFGVAAGFFLARGTHLCFIYGGILYGLSNILDCCDGMLARIKKNGTITGRIIDGVVDYVTGIAVYVGLGIGLAAAVSQGSLHLPGNAWILVGFTAASTALHAILSDYFRNSYLDQQRSPSGGIADEKEKFTAELSRLNTLKGHRIDKTLIKIYLGYLGLQSGQLQRRSIKDHPAKPRLIKPAQVMLWNLIGPSTHISFFILAALVYRPMILFVFVIILANLWTIALLGAGPLYFKRQKPGQ
jgi:hypothetical protein